MSLSLRAWWMRMVAKGDVLVTTPFSMCEEYLYLHLFMMRNLQSRGVRTKAQIRCSGGWTCPKAQHHLARKSLKLTRSIQSCER